jgi:hypothetical protein
LMAGSFVLAGCGGGGGSGAADMQTSASTGSTIRINTPTTLGRYETFEERIDLGGSSAVPEGAQCSAAIVNGISGVSISWRNATNNTSGRGTSSLFCVGIVAATWNIRSIPLAIGNNQIEVSGSGGSDTIIVERLRDETPPFVTSVNPAQDADNVKINRTITAGFNESMATGTIHAASFVLQDSVANGVPAVVRYSNLGRVAELTPMASLKYLETYTATLTRDIADDRGGNRLTEDFTWQFTTGSNPDEIAPEVVAVHPEPTSTCVAVDTEVSATLSERPNIASINSASFRLATGNGTPVAGALSVVAESITLSPDSNLVPGTTYRATVGEMVTDLAGNALINDFSWSFEVASGGQGSWSAMTESGAPTPRTGHVAVWIDGEMFVWGGRSSTATNNGAIYDPAIDRWREISTTGAPSYRLGEATAVWTGTENGSQVLMWGRIGGKRYDVLTDEWRAISTTGGPTRRLNHTAVWTGTEMIVWGGQSYYGEPALANGAAYNPVTDTWRRLSSVAAPSGRFNHTAVWSGQEMIVWGGADSVFHGDAAAYDPNADTWRPLTTTDAPGNASGHGAVWTGSEMIVWDSSPWVTRAGRYDPAADLWLPMSELCAPRSGDDSHAVWTGTQMIVWGGEQGSLYDPASDSWQPMTSFNAPGERFDYVSVWTGSELIIWGGGIPFTSNLLGTGAIFRP